MAGDPDIWRKASHSWNSIVYRGEVIMVEHLLSKSTDTLTAIEEDFKEEDSAAEKDEENRQGNANYAN